MLDRRGRAGWGFIHELSREATGSVPFDHGLANKKHLMEVQAAAGAVFVCLFVLTTPGNRSNLKTDRANY